MSAAFLVQTVIAVSLGGLLSQLPRTPVEIFVGIMFLVGGLILLRGAGKADTETADLSRERIELQTDPVAEQRELAGIYVQRGLDPELSQQVARQLMLHDALGAHARDELGMSDVLGARPWQAAWASAASFATGAALPLAVVALAPPAQLMPWVAGASLVFLAALGSMAARAGGAPVALGAARVTFWGALAMGITAGAGALFGAVA